jgi:hypothetical protein
MRARFPEIVECGRVTSGTRATAPGETYGAFFVVHPRTKHRFKIVASDGMGWDHVSVSLRKRTPTWDEMCWVKSLFFEPEECVVQYHPPASVYVNISTTCLHLWRPQSDAVPLPPRECV